jgi:hypothetical protein
MHVQCGLTQNVDIALTGFRKFDNRRGDHFVAEVGWAVNSGTGGFESYTHEADGLRIEGLAA